MKNKMNNVYPRTDVRRSLSGAPGVSQGTVGSEASAGARVETPQTVPALTWRGSRTAARFAPALLCAGLALFLYGCGEKRVIPSQHRTNRCPRRGSTQTRSSFHKIRRN